MNSRRIHSGFDPTISGTLIGILASANLREISTAAQPVGRADMAAWDRFSPTAGLLRVTPVAPGQVSSLLEETRASFERLAAAQVALAPEFAQVLAERIWDLYER